MTAGYYSIAMRDFGRGLMANAMREIVTGILYPNTLRLDIRRVAEHSARPFEFLDKNVRTRKKLRQAGGYHLTVDEKVSGVYVHFDALNPWADNMPNWSG